jgi:hypothetical protein
MSAGPLGWKNFCTLSSVVVMLTLLVEHWLWSLSPVMFYNSDRNVGAVLHFLNCEVNFME